MTYAKFNPDSQSVVLWNNNISQIKFQPKDYAGNTANCTGFDTIVSANAVPSGEAFIGATSSIAAYVSIESSSNDGVVLNFEGNGIIGIMRNAGGFQTWDYAIVMQNSSTGVFAEVGTGSLVPDIISLI